MKDQLGSWAFTQGTPTLVVFKSPNLKYSGNPLIRILKGKAKIVHENSSNQGRLNNQLAMLIIESNLFFRYFGMIQ